MHLYIQLSVESINTPKKYQRSVIFILYGINNNMPRVHKTIDTFQTRVMQSYVNLTKYNSTQYPAASVVRIEILDQSNAFADRGTVTDLLTTVSIYDQWALRVITNSAPLSSIVA